MFELNAKVFTPVIVAIIFVCTVFANFTPPAKASTCDPNGGVNVCAAGRVVCQMVEAVPQPFQRKALNPS
jgi:hypothetical protein